MMHQQEQAGRLGAAEAEHMVATLNRRYVRCLDRQDLAGWPDFFDERGRYLIQPRDNRDAGLPGGYWMYFSSKGMIRDRVTSLSHINKFHRRYERHMLGDTLLIDIVGDVIHASTTYYLAQTTNEGKVSLFNVGEYLDKVVIRESSPLFLEKLVVTDSFNPQGAVIFPI